MTRCFHIDDMTVCHSFDKSGLMLELYARALRWSVMDELYSAQVLESQGGNMAHFPNLEELACLSDSLDQKRRLPRRSDADSAVVCWRVFRKKTLALEFARHVQLVPSQRLIGGHLIDSIGSLWWVGVEVDSIAAWGNRDAVHKAELPALQSL